MAFFRNEPISEVARRLNICAEGLANDAFARGQCPVSGPSATRQTAARVAVKQCADVGGGNVILKTIGTVYRSLPSMGPCSEPRICLNSGTFRLGNTSTNRQTPYPMLRLVTLMNVRSHVIANAAISPYRKKSPASEFIHSLPDKSVTLLDKGFFGADLLLRIQAEDTDRH